MQTVTRQAQVQLAQDTVVDATLGVQGVTENVTVTASATLIDKDVGDDQERRLERADQALPVGQEYRDLIKLIPGVQYTQDTTRGPSAGGSGQDNVYQFDGVNVTLPLFGTLSAEPASHDIAQVTIDQGRRAGGRLRPLRRLLDRLGQQVRHQPASAGSSATSSRTTSMAAELDSGSAVALRAGPQLDRRRTSAARSCRTSCSSTARTTGPRTRATTAPTSTASCREYESTRNEGFGKLTFTPTQLDPDQRQLPRLEARRTRAIRFASNAGAARPARGNEARQKIGTADGSWVINARSFATFKYTDFANRTQGRPDNIANVAVDTAIGTRLDIANLDTHGRLTVPDPDRRADRLQRVRPAAHRPLRLRPERRADAAAARSAIGSQFDDDDFFRDAGQVGYNLTLGSGDARTTCTSAISATSTRRT